VRERSRWSRGPERRDLGPESTLQRCRPGRDGGEKSRPRNSTFQGNVRLHRGIMTRHHMTSATAPYRLSAAVTLLGMVLVAVTLGGAADRQYCGQSQRATSTVNADPVPTRSPALDRNAAPHALSSVATGQASTPRPECDSDRPAGAPSPASTRPVHLTDHNEWGPQQASLRSLGGARASVSFHSERQGTPPLVSRAQGSLGTVRSVVLRL